MQDIERKNAINRAYYQRNKERLALEKREKYKQNPTKMKKNSLNSYYRKMATPNGRNEYREYRNKINYTNRLKTIEILGGKCVKCGFSDWRGLEVDHVKSDGKKERLERGHAQSALHTAIRKNPERFQLLCCNCNKIKQHELGEFYGRHPLWEK